MNIKALTTRASVDTMADMPIPTGFTTHTDQRSMFGLAMRATWLHLHLTGEAGLVLAPREREVLALVATSPTAVPESLLLRRLQGLGVRPPLAQRVLQDLTCGWLSIRTDGDEPLYDLPAEDLSYIATHVHRVAA